MSPDSPPPSVFRSQPSPARWLLAAAAFCALAATSGCNRFRAHSETQYVYVIAKQSILRDRVAAVSNRVGEVTNGEKLEVLERDRRFVKVKTPDGAVGWLEARLTADQALADQFEALQKQHQHDPVVASGTAHDDVYLHILPGRETDRFYRLAEGDSMSLLQRATVPKPLPPGSALAEATHPAFEAGNKADKNAKSAPPPPPPMEDWWLVRTQHGETGWIYSRLVDVNVPDAIARYAEGQRIVGAYVLAMVDDPDAATSQTPTSRSKKRNAAAAEEAPVAPRPVTNIPEYLTVVNSWKSGLPYDFDEVRVFIWNLKKHRYETSFREHNIMGYLPVKLFKSKDPYGKTPDAAQQLPTFSYNVLAADAPPPVADPRTGEIKPGEGKPGALITKTYRLEGNICRRLLPPNTPAPEEAHPAPEPKKEKAGKRKR
jgi:SH3-like domain-containing protein